jgi:chromate transport protein ChrA
MNRYMPGMLASMLVLIVPAFLICVGLTILAYRRWKADQAQRR